MIDKRVRLTAHAYKRHRQRVGGMSRHTLQARLNTALQCGLYREGFGLIKLCGVWWGCVIDRDIVLTTCYGRQDHDMIAERRRGHASQAEAPV